MKKLNDMQFALHLEYFSMPQQQTYNEKSVDPFQLMVY